MPPSIATKNLPALLTCAACGSGDEVGALDSCECGAALHEECAQFSLCPECPTLAAALPLPATSRLRFRRIGATLLDVGVLLAPALGAVAGGVALGLGGWATFALGTGTAVTMDAVNTGLLLGEGGATLGKKLVGLRMVNERGRNLGWRRALTREFVHKLVGYPEGHEAYLLEG